VARVLDRGTATRSADAIADELDGRGASLSVVAGRHQLTVSATCLAEDFDTIFGLLAEIVRRPRFEPSQVATRRAELATSILQDEDDPAAVAVDQLMSRLYEGHPYGRRARGTLATIGKIGRDDLLEFHRSWFSPAGTILVVVGDVDPQRVAEAAKQRFEDWTVNRKREVPPADMPPAPARRLVAAPMMNKAQADVAYGFIGLRRSDPDFYAAWVANNALGQYALGGRLGDSIRERQGMAYYVYSTLDASLAAGPFMIRAGVSGADVQRTLDSIDHELRQVRDEGISVKELEDSKRYLIGSIPRQLETNAGIAGFLMSVEFFGLGEDYEALLPDLITSVTIEDAGRVAARLLDVDRASIVVAGPWDGGGQAEVIAPGAADSVNVHALMPTETPQRDANSHT
jgi:zinc protease